MSTNQQDKAKHNLLRQIWQLSKTNPRQQNDWLLRSVLVAGKSNNSQTGFVLPTVTLVLLVVGLTVAALLFRSLSRTNQVIGQREQQEIYNAATPAIDRAKSKLEYLFTNGRLPAGIPPEAKLAELMSDSVYDFPGRTSAERERRLDLNKDGTPDNAWVYTSFIDKNGNNIKDPDENTTTIAYSILMKTEDGVGTTKVDVNNSEAKAKADKLVVRSGPVSTVQPSSNCVSAGSGALEQGWFKDSVSSGFLRKNFQVNAVVLNTGTTSQTVATLEFQQERQVNRGNKWGAWFLNDLEIFPGPAFNWNGSLHTEGSIFLGQSGSSQFKGYLISSPASCLYGTDGLDASEISMNQVTNPATGAVLFQGQIVSGSMKENTFAASGGRIDRSPTAVDTLTSSNDSIKQDAVSPNKTPADLALDALSLLTENKSKARSSSDSNNTLARDPAWDSSNPLAQGSTQRVFNKAVDKPYVDDTYRADNRYGPKMPPKTEKNINGLLPSSPIKKVGATIESGDNIFDNSKEGSRHANLVSNTPIAGNNENVGLDGYWERRARNEGLRIIVGQRLELGNPLPVPGTLTARPHESLQRRALRDNLSAVQATVIYFHENNTGDVPVACLATTVHPGTATTLRRSATFETISYNTASGATPIRVYNDFFSGYGTNGWEYAFRNGTPNAAQLRALNNLANFAGDPRGAFPPLQEAPSSTIVHPYLELTRHGDFSNLRRALANLVTSGYSNLSIADKSYIDTASCALGMVADQIGVLQNYNYAQNTTTDPVALLDDLNTQLGVAPYATIPANSPLRTIAALESAAAALAPGVARNRAERLAQLARFVSLKEQVALDRTTPPTTLTCGLTVNLNKLCPSGRTPDSALHYIFPITNHGEVAPRSTDPYIATVNTGLNLYQAISTADLADISFTPRSSATTGTLDNLEVTGTPDPVNGGTYGTNINNVPNHRQFGLIRYVDRYNGAPDQVFRIPFKDTALFNGREMMNVRVLNIDLDLLRRNKPNALDTWLPASGIVYAFREDAVREDGIARPTLGAWSDYESVWNNNITSGPPSTGTTPIWRANANSSVVATRKDQPVNGMQSNGLIAPDGTGISPKPIDYYPDPDRRPYGFRLKQGINLTRTGADNTYGLSFISDNPTYIQGDFNHHLNATGTRLEEFTQLLTYFNGGANDGFYSNFYDRTTVNTQFAKAADSWRPTEILADAITILSDSFCDGSIEDGFITPTALPLPNRSTNTNTVNRTQYGCAPTDGVTSYLNQNRPNTNISADWLRENPAEGSLSPIRIDENGLPHIGPAVWPGITYNAANFQNFGDGKQLNQPGETRINAIMVSGLVPSRALQPYGGLHNFPRFIENWSGRDLYISGSFIQLNFSTYATAPFDQDAWEINQNSVGGGESISYYGAPNRRWGYDVGLQYQAPGSVSRRFTSVGATRSEFYKEIPVNDPYILKLRCATNTTTGQKVDPKASCS